SAASAAVSVFTADAGVSDAGGDAGDDAGLDDGGAGRNGDFHIACGCASGGEPVALLFAAALALKIRRLDRRRSAKRPAEVAKPSALRAGNSPFDSAGRAQRETRSRMGSLRPRSGRSSPRFARAGAHSTSLLARCAEAT